MMLIKPIRIKTPQSDNLQRAKLRKVETFYQGQLRKTGKTLIGKCPFHEDHHPSFAIYPATNSWTCFAGCGSGDSIDFYMRIYKVDFKDAIRAMS